MTRDSDPPAGRTSGTTPTQHRLTARPSTDSRATAQLNADSRATARPDADSRAAAPPDAYSQATPRPWYIDAIPQGFIDDLDATLTGLLVAEPAEQYLSRHARRAFALAVLASGATLLTLTVSDIPLLWCPAAALLLGICVGLGRYGAALVSPRVVLDATRREIDSRLPHAILSLHSVVQSGTDLTTAIGRVAAMETTGAVRDEFARIRDDVAWFGGDLVTALERRRDETPSEDFAVFLDELLTVVQTGGDVPDFLETEVDAHFQTAADRQERIAQATATYAEGYVTLVFAAPIFLLVVLVVIGFIEPAAQRLAALVVYAGIPAMLLGFAAIFRLRVRPVVSMDGGTATASRPMPLDPPTDADALAARHEAKRARHRYLELARTPVRFFIERPTRSLVPAALLAVLVAIAAILALGSTDRVSDALHLSLVGALPLVVLLTPYAILYEHRRNLAHRVRGRVPAALHVIADGLENGIPVPEVFGLASRRTSGRLATALRQVDRDISWHAPVPEALDRIQRRVADRPTIRAVQLVGTALQSTHDVGNLVHTIARFIQDQHALVEERRIQATPYVAVVSIGIVVFLGIVALFDIFFLDRIAAIEPGTVTSVSAQTEASSRPSDVDVTAYRRILYHATILQALGNGLVLGILVDDRLATGAKYAALFLAVTALTLAGLGLFT